MAMVATFASSGIAAADDISNTLDASIDATAEVMPLNVGGPDGTTTLAVTPRNGDDKNGCNLTGSTTLSVAVNSSDATVASVDPGSVTFQTCGDLPTLTVTPHKVGQTTISLSLTSNSSGGTFNLVPATFTVNVAPPANTAPAVSVQGVTQSASYNKGSVPTATCLVTDAEDQSPAAIPTLSAITGPYAADGIGSQTASCSYTDAGGLQASSSATYSIVDPSAPIISYTLNPTAPDGLLGWYKGTVTLTWHVSEPQSPNSLIKSGCGNQTITADQAATNYSCSASSAGGSSGDPVTVTVSRDGNGPDVTYTSANPVAPDGTNGWYVSPVTATFTATDGFSGPASQTGTNVSTTDGGAVTIPSPAFSDNAGNATRAGADSSPAFKIDTVDPDAPEFVGGPADGSSYYFGSVPAAPTCTSDDDTSGLASCVVTGGGTAVGQHTWTATATDNAGNTNTDSVSYTVLAWTTKGFYSPVDMNGVLNKVKGGSTVPLKFELLAGATELTSTAAVKSFAYKTVACDNSSPSDDIEMLTSGSTSLRYDTTGGQFIQNWKVPTALGCYRAVMTAQDNSTIEALFKVMK
jgi:hypothetical protein